VLHNHDDKEHQSNINASVLNREREKSFKLAYKQNMEARREKMSGFEANDTETLKDKLQSLSTNFVYLGLLFALTGLYFVVTGIQYWLPTYLKEILGANDEDAAAYYLTLSFTGPISGVIVGGIVTTYAGGYNTENGQKI